MSGLPQNVYVRCRTVLRQCVEFDNHQLLQAIFVTQELEPYKQGLPLVERLDERVDRTIDYLHPLRLTDGRRVFVFFLRVLCERQNDRDQRHRDLQELITLLESEEDASQTAEFHLTFANREKEKLSIQYLLETGYYVQIHGPGGLGKTYLLREMQRIQQATQWHTIWIDFAGEHRFCQADSYRFLEECARQLVLDAMLPIASLALDQAIAFIGRKLADMDKVVLFLDNADYADRRILSWIRATLLEQIGRRPATPLQVIGSGQQIIQEWQGHRPGRPFKELALSNFDDPNLIASIINDTVTRSGSLQVKKRQTTQDTRWKDDVQQMVGGLFKVSRGHPLAIERILYYALEQDGLVDPTFFMSKHTELCERCLAPIVGERILPTVDRQLREAFRSLCIFRSIWPTLIQGLCYRSSADEPTETWEPFSTDYKTWQSWWSGLQDTHLIQRPGPRQIYELSPVIRQITALVLRAENEPLYRARNQRARVEYEKMLKTISISPMQRAAMLIEVFYHLTQDGSLTPATAEAICIRRLTNFLEDPLVRADFVEIAPQLRNWLRADAELAEALEQIGAATVYDQLIEITEAAIHDWEGTHHE